MKVSCPSCGTSYRVADDKVPEGGARIKCPKCSTVFIGKRPQSNSAPPAATQPASASEAPKARITLNLPLPPASPGRAASNSAPADKGSEPALPPVLAEARHEQATPLQQLGAPLPGKPPTGAEQSARPPELSEPPAAPSPGEGARGMSAIRAQSGAPRTPLLESYRVRTSRGLTYDFPNRETMMRWLSEREDLDGCEVAEPGGDWVPASALLDFAAPVASTAEMLAHVPGVPVASPRSTARQAGKAALGTAAGARAGAGLWVATLLVFILVVLVGAATATRYGLADFSNWLPLKRIGVEFPHSRPQSSAGGADAAETPGQRYLRALRRARQAARQRAYSRAALEYNRALAIRPGSAEALRGLAEACEKLGDLDRARAVRRKLAAVTGKP